MVHYNRQGTDNKRLGIASPKLDLNATPLLPRLGYHYRIEDGRDLLAGGIE